jgi:hypothetical protein
MKLLITALASLFIFASAYADTSAAERFLLNGGINDYSMDLQTEKTHTEYRYEDRPDTCYRSVQQRVCRRVPQQCRQECRNGRCRRVCTPPRQHCYYRTVQRPYRCIRRVRIPYEVIDYRIFTRVNFEFVQPQGATPAEQFTFEMNGKLKT